MIGDVYGEARPMEADHAPADSPAGMPPAPPASPVVAKIGGDGGDRRPARQGQQPQQPGTPIAMRSNFNPLAAFSPAVTTDAGGPRDGRR